MIGSSTPEMSGRLDAAASREIAEGDQGSGNLPGKPGATSRTADVIVSIVLIAVSLYVLYETRSYPGSMVEGAPGPALFPRLLAVSLLILSIIMLATGRRAAAINNEQVNFAGLKKIGAVVLLMIGFLALAGRADFFVLLFLLLAGVITIAGERRMHMILLVPALFVVFVYLVFYRTFGVMYPTQLF